jgi:hypothetical protein
MVYRGVEIKSSHISNINTRCIHCHSLAALLIARRLIRHQHHCKCGDRQVPKLLL